ncbi:MAG: DUF342 domain-containing protein [Fidelibacterota bacterium]|nr:MAG: DUF342 domain-containing protein [Candidatus Neomarinimicrobiota bacterium]
MSGQLDDQENSSGENGPIQVRILEEGYTAALLVPEEVSAFPSLKQVYLAIENSGVKYGINDGALERIIQEPVKGKAVIFAKGKLPTEGGGSRLIWHENSGAEPSTRDITREVVEPGREPCLFLHVKEGQQILSKLPATGGEAGINVFGETINLPGDDIPLPAGEGTSLSKDGLTLLADRSGLATWTGDKVSVVDIQHIEGNVNGLTGDIKINGSVHIEKDVLSGSRVEALGDIFIGGNVEDADVYSRRGSVVVRNGILGQGRARILAGRNVVAGFVQDATVGAKLNVEVDRYMINSAITAGHYITATSNEGIVRGGTIFAEKRIEVRNAGSESRIATEMKVGYTAPHNISRARYQLRHDQRHNRMELAYVQKRLAFLKLLRERMGELTDDKEKQLVSLEEQESVLLGQYREHSTKDTELEGKSEVADEDLYEAETIRIHDTIYSKVSLAIGDATLEMNKERHNLIFFRAGDNLAFGPLRQALAEQA